MGRLQGGYRAVAVQLWGGYGAVTGRLLGDYGAAGAAKGRLRSGYGEAVADAGLGTVHAFEPLGARARVGMRGQTGPGLGRVRGGARRRLAFHVWRERALPIAPAS